MSPNLAVRVQDLSKQYRIGAALRAPGVGGYLTLRDVLLERLRASVRKFTAPPRDAAADGDNNTIWALQDVTLEIKSGEVVGIIGRNGAGKSTLLKILSRITEPTTGFAETYGRVGSLLEVGTGFHPELTGRENIFLNGAILGMKRAEIARKFDDIVAFAELERFIDTAVKHYSSGMYMRLAFAVAAHLEPEILLVDEVLAVGDSRFQRKCLNKMQTVGQEGRTVLFVSHNMPAVTRLCERVILLDGGRVVHDGPARGVVGLYMSSESGTAAARLWADSARAPGGAVARLRGVRVLDDDGRVSDAVDIRRPVTLEMEYDVLKSGYLLLPYFDLHNAEGVCVFSTNDNDPAWRRRRRPEGRWVSTVTISGNLLAEGMLFVMAGLIAVDPFMKQFEERDAVAFQVVDSHDGDSARGDWVGEVDGVMRPMLPWTSRLAAQHREANPTVKRV
jgi:lipopolysaccharide transport system ATP-binding protein